MSKCVLLTGATGFVGGAVARHFVRQGFSVALLLRPGSDFACLDDIRSDVTVHVHDGAMSSMQKIFDDVRPDIVVHLASLFIAEHTAENIDALIQSNIGFSAQLAEAASLSGVAGFLNVGTSWQGFEGDDARPVNLYAATKAAFECLLRWYADARKLRSITLKLYDTYGLSDRRRKLIGILTDAFRSSTALEMSPGDQILDLTHVDDIANAFIIAAERLLAPSSVTYESFLLSGTRLTLKALVAKFGEMCDDQSRPDITFGGRPYRAREVMEPITGPGLPGWRIAVTLDDGIRQMLQGWET